MKTLLVLRHAEAVPQGVPASDHGRALTAAGAAQAQRLGARLREQKLTFARAICSSALRARQTAEAVIAANASPAPIVLTDDFYNAAGQSMLAVLAAQPDPDGSILLVSHMPGVAELAELLLLSGGPVNFQPGMLARFALDIGRWIEIHPGCGTLAAILPP